MPEPYHRFPFVQGFFTSSVEYMRATNKDVEEYATEFVGYDLESMM